MNDPVRAAYMWIGFHVAVQIAHGAAHSRMEIPLSPWQLAFIAVVITIAPLVAAVLLWKRMLRVGGVLLAAAMAGSLIFGVWYHFLVMGPDHVSAMPSNGWGLLFQGSAVFLAYTEAMGFQAGLKVLKPAS